MRADMKDRRFVLATDLDGTFLGGSDADRRALYQFIEDNRQTVGLVFVTGRDPEFIADLCRSGVPWPEYAVGDVGTTIARVSPDRGVEPIAKLEESIAKAWGDAGERVKAALAGVQGLTLQPTPFRYRVSFDLDMDALDERAFDIVEDLGFDTIVSDDKFFDVLPKGISKGPSILRLVEHLGLAKSHVLVAGDTMNDASMLECGLPAVAVGGSEKSLLDRVAHLPHVHVAKAIGAAGITEAIDAFDLHPLSMEA